jgi:hypothetical protein
MANLAFSTQNKAKLCKNLIITLVFERKKSPKIGNFYSNYVAVTATELG